MVKRFQGRLWFDTLLVLIGTFILAMSIYIFTAPNKIAPGGISGLATVINHLTDWNIGLLNALINLPLLLLGFFYIGKGFMFKTMISVFSFSVFYDYVMPLFPYYEGDHLLAAVFGGVLMGIGIAITFAAEACTGGVDILAKVLQKWFPHVKLGSMMFLVDAFIVIFAAIAYQDITTAMYATIAIFACTQMMDRVLYGMDLGKLIVIVSRKGDEIAQAIMDTADRGVTKLYSKGAYSNEENTTLLCAVRNNEYPHLKREIYQVDPNAFFIVTTASEVVGEGFKDITKQ